MSHEFAFPAMQFRQIMRLERRLATGDPENASPGIWALLTSIETLPLVE
jgi:hypothetical protein